MSWNMRKEQINILNQFPVSNNLQLYKGSCYTRAVTVSKLGTASDYKLQMHEIDVSVSIYCCSHAHQTIRLFLLHVQRKIPKPFMYKLSLWM